MQRCFLRKRQVRCDQRLRQKKTRSRTKRDRDEHIVRDRDQIWSLRALSARTLTALDAGLALNIIGSLVKGLIPLRAFLAGFFLALAIRHFRLAELCW